MPFVTPLLETPKHNANPEVRPTNECLYIRRIRKANLKGIFSAIDGENVYGEYSIVEPDGTLRTVTYTAGRGGFNAVVNRQVGYATAAPVFVQIGRASCRERV